MRPRSLRCSSHRRVARRSPLARRGWPCVSFAKPSGGASRTSPTGRATPTISRLEREASRAARDTAILTDLAEALGVPPLALGVVSGPGQRPILGGVDRRDFLSGTVGLAVTALLPQSMTAPGRIDADTVAQCWTGLRRLVELDDHQGGGTAFHLAEEMVRRLRVGLRQGSYSSTVGREL